MAQPNFCELLDELFELDPGTTNGSTVLKEIPSWSSLTFVGLIAMIDEEYGIALSPGVIMSSETAGENEVAVTLLQISDDATVLDAGTGSGRESISLCHASPLPPPIHGHALTQSPPCHGGGMGTSFARQAKCQGRTYPPPPAPGV